MVEQDCRTVQVEESGRMTVRSAGGEVTCRLLVSTLPPRLLAHSVTFSPALREEEVRIMKETHTWMGESIKAGLTYSSPFWREKQLAGAVQSQCGPFLQLYDQSSHDDRLGALVTLSIVLKLSLIPLQVGFLSPDLSSLTRAERETEVKAQLVKMFGPEAGDSLQYWETLWEKEKFTVWCEGKETERPLSQNNYGHPLYQAPLLGGRLILGGSETALRGAGFMEGAVNSAATIMGLITNLLSK